MANFFPNDLNFGHFGQAIYDTENREWRFGRRHTGRRKLKQLGSWETALSSSTLFDRSVSPDHRRNPRNVQQEVKALVRSNPDLVPSSDILLGAAISSAAVTSVTSTYDPAIGDLLSFGRCINESRRRPTRIAALPTGEVGNILRLVLLTKEKHGWGTGKSIWVEGPAITDEVSGYWMGEGAPIQQICFAQSEDQAITFLMTRFPTRTVLFRPTYHTAPQPATRSRFYEFPPSRLNPCPFLSISMEQTGRIPHADVTFNPEYQYQLGLIDQKGNWSVWDIEGRYLEKHTVSCTNRGTITPLQVPQTDDPETKTAHAPEDGWARILWIGDVNTILVCNRRKLEICDVRGDMGKPKVLECPNIISPRSADWILDVKQRSEHKHQFFALTSTRLYLLAVICLNDAQEGDNKSGASILLSWRHFRGSDDITLQLCVASASEEETLVLLYSRLNALMTVFRFSDYDSDSSLPFSCSDPTELKLDEDISASARVRRHISSLHLSRMQFGESELLPGPGPGFDYRSNNVNFHRLSVVLSDLSIHDILLYSLDPENELLVEPTSWQTKKRLRPSRSANTIDDDDDFMIPDGMELGSVPKVTTPYRAPRQIQSQRANSLKLTLTSLDDPRTMDSRFMYDELVKTDMLHDNSSEADPEAGDVLSLIQRVNDMLIADPIEYRPLGTLLDLAPSQIRITDIDEVSSQLVELFNNTRTDFEDSPSLELRRIASEQVLRLIGSNNSEPAIAFLYDIILQNFIAPLPYNIPSCIRQAKERLTRRIAVEVMLASSQIRSVEQHQPTQAPMQSQAGPSQDRGIALPILPSRKGKEREHEMSSDPGLDTSSPPPSYKQPIRTAPPTTEPTPSLASGTSYTTPYSTTEFPAKILSQHLQITHPKGTIRPSVKQVLLHWERSTDPWNYDWDTVTRTVQEELGSRDGMSAERRAKLQRKAERHLKRQRRETELMQKRNVESQPVVRSSPGPVEEGIGLGSSQSQVQGLGSSQVQMVASQTVPGRFGGRLDRKGKKKEKSRMSGWYWGMERRNWMDGDVRILMSGFPRLQPAFTVRIDIDAPLAVGAQAGAPLAVVPLVSGTVKSEPEFEPGLDAVLHGVGYDYIHNDADGGNMRLDVRSQVKNNDGTIFVMYYKGTVGLTAGVKALLSGSPDAKTTPYGDSFVTFSFETGSTKYKDLENGTFVAAGHFIKEPGQQGIIVEYKVSKVVFKG
ncbi:hypothetical protein K469DRAFT_627997 [Zopfia rhizophila CBS 207.26]|uniref:RNA polymerase I-specific transcription initiation factor RRN6-like protein n=1 Tax=Zopfia rhizophila CBS 207.26 TaxID=1314779 RepID=A0A6A6E930_9PEZI|nr:hypothetical protein K469DRAFT_627997 [Zopfia rhizophila CBS 207.26]